MSVKIIYNLKNNQIYENRYQYKLIQVVETCIF